MAFFKFRKGGDEHPVPPAQPESIEAMRKRAMHRLIGAAVLVLAGVIGFPLLFDSQPRPISVDIPIEIPDKSKAKPLAVAPTPAVAPAAVASVVAPPTSAPPEPTAVASPSPAVVEARISSSAPKSEDKQALAPANKASEATKSVAKADVKNEFKAESKVESKVEATSIDGAKAKALLEDKPVAKPAEKSASAASEGRFVVQVGAFADATRAKDARTKVESAGMKTYTQVVETKEGQRTRVRVGPFSDKGDAEKAAKKIKALDLPAAILTL